MNARTKSILIHSSLFIATLITTTFAGAEWTYGKSAFLADFSWSPDYTWSDFASGLPYSLSFLFILTVHEFGHYFTAIYNKVKATLPYYIPLPPITFLFGTLGAVIRIKSLIPSRQQNFDIGIAGPLAGFVAAIGILTYGFLTLPSPEYIFQFHPEYEQFGLSYAEHVYNGIFLQPGTADIILGKNLIFTFFEKFIGDPSRVPNSHEIIHYPLLFAGYLSLIFTCLNLIPIGQLDGGHVLYGLIGYEWHKRVATVLYGLFVIYTGLGFVSPAESTDVLIYKIPIGIAFLFLCFTGFRLSKKDTLMTSLIVFVVLFFLALFFPALKGSTNWWPFVLLIGRFAGVAHPPSPIEAPLTFGRKILGWLALLIFILCFTPNPLEVIFVR
jgi:membrane-associated protease RseP (regulator of RpoE activity)